MQEIASLLLFIRKTCFITCFLFDSVFVTFRIEVFDLQR